MFYDAIAIDVNSCNRLYVIVIVKSCIKDSGLLTFHKIRQLVRGSGDGALRAVLRDGGWAAAGQVVHAFVALAETLLLARFLNVDMFGAFVIIASAVELIFGALDFRAGEAVIKFAPELRKT